MAGWPVRPELQDDDPDEIIPGQPRPLSMGSVVVADKTELVFRQETRDMEVLYPVNEWTDDKGERHRRQARKVKQVSGKGLRAFMPPVIEGDGMAVREAERVAMDKYREYLDLRGEALHEKALPVSTTASMLDAKTRCAECSEVVAITFMDLNGRRVCGACSGQGEVAWAAPGFGNV